MIVDISKNALKRFLKTSSCVTRFPRFDSTIAALILIGQPKVKMADIFKDIEIGKEEILKPEIQNMLEPAQDPVPTVLQTEQQKENHMSSTVLTSRSKVIVETLSSKIVACYLPIVALAMNTLQWILTYNLNEHTGIYVHIDITIIYQYLGILFMLFLSITVFFTIEAMNAASQVYFGCLLSSKNGYSLAVAGFIQSGSFEKFTFCQYLPVSSKIRKVLQRVSFLWLFIEIFHILSLYISISYTVEQISEINDNVDCIWNSQAGIQKDRGWPTFEVASGVSEYVFGRYDLFL